MAEISDDLKEVGAVLASAVSDEPPILTADQRETLGRATIADTLDTIAVALIGDTTDVAKFNSQQIMQIADAWESDLRAVFHAYWTPERIFAIQDSASPGDLMLEAILECPYLTEDECEYFENALSKPASTSSSSNRESGPAYLSRIVVRGFRGIGPESSIIFDPEPGLTLVYGANGSGKSSFVEALDVLFTGSTPRFDTRGLEWRSAWQNAHLSDAGGGYVKASFAIPASSRSSQIDLERHWSMAGDRDIKVIHDHDERGIDSQLRKLGWSDALDVFRPILGYAELGPLFDEDPRLIDRRETPLAHHLRLRLNISPDLVNQFWPSDAQVFNSSNLSDVVSSWWYVVSGRLDDRAGRLARNSKGGAIKQLPVFKKRFLPPSQWNWEDLRAKHRRRMRMIRVLESIYSSVHTLSVHPVWNPKMAIYCEVLAQAFYDPHHERLSKLAMDLWKTIRPGSALRFDGIKLKVETLRDDKPSVPTFRISLSFSIEGAQKMERGVLSQGQLHSLALSVFLPLMMQDESPFRFVVIDDPVQVMDEHAVNGLAEALESVSDDLQVIVFTHDQRLPQAAAQLEIDHTLINVTRSEQSIVECETVSDPVSQRIDDARSEANRHAREDEMVLVHRQDVANQCRKAIEAALIRSIRRQLIQTGKLSRREVEEELDRILERPATSTRRLLALAIWGIDGGGRIGEIASYVTNNKNWGRDVHRTLSRVNDLYHARTATEAHEAYSGDLHHLIDDVEWLIRKIEENCG